MVYILSVEEQGGSSCSSCQTGEKECDSLQVLDLQEFKSEFSLSHVSDLYLNL